MRCQIQAALRYKVSIWQSNTYLSVIPPLPGADKGKAAALGFLNHNSLFRRYMFPNDAKQFGEKCQYRMGRKIDR